MAICSYDKRCDVLYVSLTDPPQPARTWSGELIALCRFDDAGKLVGVTIEALARQAAKVKT